MKTDRRKKQVEYEGDEKRKDYCPVHHIRCSEIKTSQDDIKALQKSKVPVWAFNFLVMGVFIVVGYTNYQGSRELSYHVEASTAVLAEITIELEKMSDKMGRLSHSNIEVATNQKDVMKKLGMNFRPIPYFE